MMRTGAEDFSVEFDWKSLIRYYFDAYDYICQPGKRFIPQNVHKKQRINSKIKTIPDMFTDNDLEQITQRELSPEAVEKQISYFKSGFPPLEITQAASVGNGYFA